MRHFVLMSLQSSLGGDNGELYLFQWLTSNDKALQHAPLVRKHHRILYHLPDSLPKDILKSSQEALQATLINIVTSASPYPNPGHPIRTLVAQCLTTIYTRGETRTLFDTIQALLKPCSEPKSLLQDVHRV